MSSVLPVSDLDNPHVKRRMQYSTRFKVSSIVGALLFGALLIYGFFGSPSSGTNYAKYMPSSSRGSGDKPLNSAEAVSSTECTRSFDGKKPVNQYVVMIDAGSSGSRVHVYHFNNCQKIPVLIHEEFKMIEPGLSQYASEPHNAARSLDTLLDVALKSVPEDVHKCTPIAVKATAGLRKLGNEKSQQILDAVQTHLTENYPFPVVEDGVSIMSGEDEGVFAWVTANFLLGNIGSSDKTPTVAVFDLGGGSTQIVFEPTFKDTLKTLADGDHKYSLSFGGRDFVLYQHSYLGYGLNEARDKINREIVQQQGPKSVYRNPCLPPNTSFTINMKVPDGSASREGANLKNEDVSFEGPTVFSPLQCRSIAEKILDKEAICANPPCAFSGVHQPKLLESFPAESDMYVFSFFYDRTAPLGMPQSFSLDELRQLTALVCQGKSAYSAFDALSDAVAALEKNPQWCTELSYMDALLRTGYEIRGHREVRIAKKINGNELGWCLGASLPLLDGANWKCKQLA